MMWVELLFLDKKMASSRFAAITALNDEAVKQSRHAIDHSFRVLAEADRLLNYVGQMRPLLQGIAEGVTVAHRTQQRGLAPING